jgi:tRNA pseudouridine38-40 synthase
VSRLRIEHFGARGSADGRSVEIGGSTTRWLIQFGYDGRSFSGWARQPGQTTVEGTLRDGLRRHGIGGRTAAGSLEVASRTDAGVSARANALTLTSDWAAPALLRALNGISPRIFFRAATEVPDGFRVRHARFRQYRYFLDGGPERVERLQPIADRLGHRVDARSFGRGLPAAEPKFRPLNRITVRHDGVVAWIEVEAPSFVWGMVRKIVTGLGEVESGRRSAAELERAALGEQRLTLALAPPEPLVLWAVEYDRPWSHVAARLSRHQEAHLREMDRQARLLPALRRAIGFGSGDPPPSG